MTATVVKLNSGKYAVKIGRASKGRFTYLAETVSDTPEFPKKFADYRNAAEHIEKARELLANLDIDKAYAIGARAYSLTDDVAARAEDEDPDFNANDPKAFLA